MGEGDSEDGGEKKVEGRAGRLRDGRESREGEWTKGRAGREKKRGTSAVGDGKEWSGGWTEAGGGKERREAGGDWR